MSLGVSTSASAIIAPLGLLASRMLDSVEIREHIATKSSDLAGGISKMRGPFKSQLSKLRRGVTQINYRTEKPLSSNKYRVFWRSLHRKSIATLNEQSPHSKKTISLCQLR